MGDTEGEGRGRTECCPSRFGGALNSGAYSFLSAIADRMNTSPLDLPWYRRGGECIDSLRMPSASSLSSSAASSSSSSSSLGGSCGSSTAEPGVGGARERVEGVRGSSMRELLAWDRSDAGVRALVGSLSEAWSSSSLSMSLAGIN